jgi:DNA topoisomerase-3
MSKLIIAEKPPSPRTLRALGGFTRKGDHRERRLRPLVRGRPPAQLTVPEEFDEARQGSSAHLPVIPPLRPGADREEREPPGASAALAQGCDWHHQRCDGREGELISATQYAKIRKPVERLWLQSMTAAIRDGLTRCA